MNDVSGRTLCVCVCGTFINCSLMNFFVDLSHQVT